MAMVTYKYSIFNQSTSTTAAPPAEARQGQGQGSHYIQIFDHGAEQRNVTWYPKIDPTWQSSSDSILSNTLVTSENVTASALKTAINFDSDFGSPANPNPDSSTTIAYFIIPLLLMMALMGVSIIIWVIIHKRKKWDDLRHTLVPRYTFLPEFKVARTSSTMISYEACSSSSGSLSSTNHHVEVGQQIDVEK